MGDIPITKSYAYYLISGPPIGTVKKYIAGGVLVFVLKILKKELLKLILDLKEL